MLADQIDIFRFHPTLPTKKMTMSRAEWKGYKRQKGFRYVAYASGFNATIC